MATGQAFSPDASPPVTSSVPIQSNKPLPSTGVRVAGAPPTIPAIPEGKSTVIGGEVRKVDRVRDELTVAVFGGRDIRALFDERTKVFRDGAAISVDDLRIGDRASLETILDGSTVFVRSVHMVTGLPQGQCRGQVLTYDPVSGALSVREALSSRPIQLRVSGSTSIVRQGQEASSVAELGPGALITADFVPDDRGHGVVRKISILATPGSKFVFTGTVAFLDMHSGALVIIDPRDQQRYEITFDPAVVSGSRQIQAGADVVVKAYFDGGHYLAQAITVNSSAQK
jgi:hypothetical protein